MLEKFLSSCQNSFTRKNSCWYGKVAQLARAFGSYPRGREFESLLANKKDRNLIPVFFICLKYFL